LVDWHFKLIEGFYWKNSAWDGNFQIKFFSGIFKMEHLSNRNLIGTFQKLNDRKYHFLRKMRNYTFLEGQERFWVSKNQKLSFKPQPEMVYSNIFFSKFYSQGFWKIRTPSFQIWTFHFIFIKQLYFTKIFSNIIKNGPNFAIRTLWVSTQQTHTENSGPNAQKQKICPSPTKNTDHKPVFDPLKFLSDLFKNPRSCKTGEKIPPVIGCQDRVNILVPFNHFCLISGFHLKIIISKNLRKF